jgi:hypothetical protein
MGKKEDSTEEGFLTKFKDFWTKERLVLLSIFLAATIIRSLPGWINAAWGNDFGIYYGITRDFAENPELFQHYSGWGDAYNYFPVLYVTVTSLHYITGAEIGWLLPRVTPVFGGLAVLIFYYISREIVEDRKVALICCAFLATNPFHIYQTAHAAPMTMGHFFMALSLYFFIKKERTFISFGALYLCSILLIASHHLTTFFFIITIIFITFYRNLISYKWTKGFSIDLFYIISFTVVTFLYWMIIAEPVWDFIRGGTLIPSWLVVVLFYIGIIVLFLLVVLRRKYLGFSDKTTFKKPSLAQSMMITVVGASIFIVIFSFIEIPRTGFKFDRIAIFVLLPLIFAVGFGVYGVFVLKDKRKRGFTLGWLYPISISLVITTVTWHQGLFPFRHLEYIAYPFSILSGVGVHTYWKMLNGKKKENKEEEEMGENKVVEGGNGEGEMEDPQPKKPMLSSKTFSYMVVFILILNLITAYGVQRVTSRYEESISQEVFEVMDWMKGNVTGYNFTIASDHRISQVLWAEGYNATSDEAYVIWFSENWTQSLGELETANGSQPRIEYILIDHVMRYDGVQSNINETPKNLTDEQYEKFQEPPFTLIFRSENQGANKWAEFYDVDWVYIEENKP